MTKLTPIVALGAMRCAIGGVIVARPTLLTRSLGVDTATANRTAWLSAMFGVRDLALGAGTLVSRGKPESRTWLVLSAICDAVDATAMLAALRGSRVHPVPAVGAAVAAVAAIGVQVRELSRF